MKKMKFSLCTLFFLFTLLTLVGCQTEESSSSSSGSSDQSTNSDSNTNPSAKVNFDLSFLSSIQSLDSNSNLSKSGLDNSSLDNSSLDNSSLDNASSKLPDQTVGVRDFTVEDVWTGVMNVRNMDDSTETNYDWIIYFDEDTWAVQSNRTVTLPVDLQDSGDQGIDYQFRLLLTKGNLQYLGTAASLIQDGTNDIAMTIRPVIGDTTTDMAYVDRLGKIKFKYNVQELSSIATPKIGVLVDNLPEQLLTINKATGESTTEISIPEGSHTVKLNLYDDGVQIGRSKPEQESVTITPSQNTTMDLVRLQGDTTFSLTEEGGEATFYFNIPAEVIQEAGNLANVEAEFRLAVSPKNAAQQESITLEASGDAYKATVTLSNVQYDTISYSVVFTEKSSGEEIASCNVENVVLDVNPRQKNCGIRVYRQALIQGSLLSTLSLNVISNDNEPVQGAKIYATDLTGDQTFMGITGDPQNFGTLGYLKGHLRQGFYQIRAEGATHFGEMDATLDALGIHNHMMKLDQSILPTAWNFVDGNGANGINKDAGKTARNRPQLTSFQNKLYAIWSEHNGSSTYQIRVARYQSGTWSFVDGNGANGINHSSSQTAYNSQLTVFQDQLYATWQEPHATTNHYQVRVVRYNGNDSSPSWSFVDGNGANGLNQSASQHAYYPQLSVFNNKLYSTWYESNGTAEQIRVKVYQGGNTWASVEGNSGNGLNQSSSQSSYFPQLTEFSGKLYATWYELNNSNVHQIRVKVYNNNDASPSWSFVDGGGVTGINKVSSKQAHHPQLTLFNEKLYITWQEEHSSSDVQQARVAVYNGNDSSPNWSFVDGNGSNGLNKDNSEGAYGPQLTVFQNRLYNAWQEYKSGAAQTRIAVYNGDDQSTSWTFVDGDQAEGLNKDSSKHAYEPQLTSVQGTDGKTRLYSIWIEQHASNGGAWQTRVVEAQHGL